VTDASTDKLDYRFAWSLQVILVAVEEGDRTLRLRDTLPTWSIHLP